MHARVDHMQIVRQNLLLMQNEEFKVGVFVNQESGVTEYASSLSLVLSQRKIVPLKDDIISLTQEDYEYLHTYGIKYLVIVNHRILNYQGFHYGIFCKSYGD